MNILITGIMGQVGFNLAHYFYLDKNNIFGTYHQKICTQFPSKLIDLSKDIFLSQQSFNHQKLDLIIHCAALTDVSFSENNPKLTNQINHLSTQKLLSLAKKNNIPFIYLSTDFVFNGNLGDYNENSHTDPLSSYAKSKLYGEQAIQSYQKSIILRFTPIGHFLKLKHHNNSLIDWIIESSLSNTKIKLFYDKTFSPISSFEIFKTIQTLILNNQFGLFHIASECNSIYQAGRLIENIFHLNKIVIPCKFPKNDYSKIRPKYSHLSSKYLKSFKLKEILQNIKKQRESI
ncbi:MAG: hypothetical protein COB02_04000 [Candidatus Cloacimonadota bacterium]|nr:MAG: hypothetical protein COB02_04000 [Candidatus Cloacimonadota bacterium]